MAVPLVLIRAPAEASPAMPPPLPPLPYEPPPIAPAGEEGTEGTCNAGRCSFIGAANT